MSLVRRYAAAGPGAAARRPRRRRMTVGALDETGQARPGSSTAGMKRQYTGCTGRVANGINTVHLSYVREKTGHAPAGARQRIPAEDIAGPVRSLLTGLPLDLRFRTKGQLAIDILSDAYADGLAFGFVCGDEVYGSCTELREYLEERGQAYVLRVTSSFMLTLTAGIKMTCAEAARKLLKGKRAWEVRSAGQGSKGKRWYARAWLGSLAADCVVSGGMDVDKLQHALGGVVLESAYLERVLREAFSALVGSKYAAVVDARMTAAVLIEDCERIARHHTAIQGPARDGLLEALQACHQANRQRNRVIHDAWAARPGDVQVTLQGGRNAHDVMVTARTPAEVSQVADRLADAAGELKAAMTAALGPGWGRVEDQLRQELGRDIGD